MLSFVTAALAVDNYNLMSGRTTMNILMAGYINEDGETLSASGQTFTVSRTEPGRYRILFGEVDKIPIVVATSAGDGGRFAAVTNIQTKRAEIALMRREGDGNITLGDVDFFFMIIEAER